MVHVVPDVPYQLMASRPESESGALAEAVAEAVRQSPEPRP